jgi:hypothetical protein
MVLSGQERPFQLMIDDLKSWLGIAPDKYKKGGKDRVDHIEDRILRPVKKLLDENCPYTFTYEKIRANPNNGKSVAVGFKFYPVYQDKYRDQELEKTRLTALTSVGFMAPKAVEYMKQRMGIPLKSIQPHKSLINKAAQLLPDFIGTLADTQGRRRKEDGSYMGIGWVIQAIRGEVEEAEKQPSLYKEWEKDK